MRRRKWICALAACVLVLGSTIAAHAETTGFTKLYVRGDRMTHVSGATKETTAAVAKVYIDNIYTSSGGFSTYSKVRIAADLYTDYVVVEKGYYYPVEIPGGVWVGDFVDMYAQGNTSWLDCMISGEWNAQ